MVCPVYTESYQLHPVVVNCLEVLLHAVDHPAAAGLVRRVLPHRANALLEEVVGAVGIQIAGQLDVIKKSVEEWLMLEK